MELVFSDPIYLWGLISVPLLIIAHFASLKYSKAMTLKFANFAALSRVTGRTGQVSNVFILFMRVSIFVYLILSIAGATLWYEGTTLDKDYVLAIDASSSMLNDDFSPTRLEAARIAAKEFVANLPIDSRVALITFSGTSFVEQPLTLDKRVVANVIDNFGLRAVGGTDFGNAIITSSNVLIPSKKSKSVVLLTDGRSNIGVADDIAISYAMAGHVTINTVGIGVVNPEDNLELGVDEESLKRIAQLTGGTYDLAEDADDLTNIYSRIVTTESIGKISFDFSFVLLILALVFMAMDWILGGTVYRRI